MKYINLILAAFLSLAAASNATAPIDPLTLDLVTGATASLSMDAIYKAKEAYFAFILKQLNLVNIPDFSFDGGSMSGNDMWINEAPTSFTITPDLHNYILFEANDITLSFVSNEFIYHMLGIFTAEGAVQATIGGLNVAFELEFSWAGAKGGRYVPSFHTVATRVTCDTDRIDLKVQGDLMASILDIISGLFKGTVHDLIISQINSALYNQLPAALNLLIEE